MGLVHHDGDGSGELVPGELEDAIGASGGIEFDGELFSGGGLGGGFHFDAAEVLVGVVLEGAPLFGGFVEDEGPFGLAGDGEEGVSAGGDMEGAEHEVALGGEGGGFIGSGTPDLAEGGEVAVGVPNVAAFDGGAAVLDGDFFAADGGGDGFAGADALALGLEGGSEAGEQDGGGYGGGQ